MSPVEFKKRPCQPVEFKGQGPQAKVIQLSVPTTHFLPLTRLTGVSHR